MKRLLLCLLWVACGGSTSGQDGGVDGASSDATTADASSTSDASDAANVADTATPDGGLQGGDDCDPKNNLCAAGLLCCPEPTHLPDASTAYFCEKPVKPGGCPLFP